MLYKIPVVYTSWGIHEIEAGSLEEAIQGALIMGLPFSSEYVDGSLEVDEEGVLIHNPSIEEE